MRTLSGLLLFCLCASFAASAQMRAVEQYSQAGLLEMIRNNSYLAQVKRDRCQIVQDIQANAMVLKQPVYQFLWGEMLNHGVCVKRSVPEGMPLLVKAAEQGLPEAMVKLARYYRNGQLVIADSDKAVRLAYPAAAHGNLEAQLLLGELYAEGHGSPRDYTQAYAWLHNAYYQSDFERQQALRILARLSERMPASQIARAKKSAELAY
ncbi:tetratricopeptide repeat protein [Paraferrimonas sedimenticola]|uniref:Flagellar rotation associated protein MotX n=1 Tax=Paraferrimonas sedimenticola TaxID=375674 RepID=A0AA37RVR5_9GAMM|nr:tetratricopeptide repeat protein [Paraferrimonas sedimenticola]GLP95732.1 flagellar rotation associated protein MotX [Paraferrimonas sedimenticola]